MVSQPLITLVALDVYGTLVENGLDLWLTTFSEIVEAQRLPITGPELWREWRSRDLNFRRTRTSAGDLKTSTPFRTYYAAWRDEFEETFRDLGLRGDAEEAAQHCIRGQGSRPAFRDAVEIMPWLQKNCRVGVISNADNRYLSEAVKRHGWEFEVVVSSESAQAYKPDPRIFETFCRQASVQPVEVLYVGDSQYDDAHGARLSGLRAAWLRREIDTPGTTPIPDDQELLPPDLEISSLLELKGVLLQSMGNA